MVPTLGLSGRRPRLRIGPAPGDVRKGASTRATVTFSTEEVPTSPSSSSARLTQRFPGLIVAGYRSPPFRPLTQEEDVADIEAINAARPDFVWVGLGTPKQEKWMVQHVGKIDAAALLGVGAAFDFLSGAKPRAPLWMQRSGFEWFFRLMTEPRRLARRYLVDNSIFVVRAIQQLAGWKSYDAGVVKTACLRHAQSD